MDYSNPEIPEGINTTREHPLREFFILLGGILAVIVIAVAILGFMAEKLAAHIPYSTERELLADKELFMDDDHPEITTYLGNLSDRLGAYMDLPEDMETTVHYMDQDIENAFATLGGHIYIYRGLMQLLPNENALAMVVAHEMAHIKHRHPIIAMGRGVVIGLFLASIAGFSGDHFVGQIVSDAGIITLLSFNRDQERDADATALAAVAGHYGHIAGSENLFETLLTLEEKHPMNPPEFLRTHPLGEKRIENIRWLAKKNNWNTDGELTPIPDNILQLLKNRDALNK
jgi:predicted Zn-dependent protease